MQHESNVGPKLGLVCITASAAVRFRALTRKRLLSLSASEQAAVLRELYTDNLQRLNNALDFCRAHEISLYRLSSALFPFADEPLGAELLDELAAPLLQTGERAREFHIRLVLHPDQFVVLNSDSPAVIENSLKILTTHARIFDLLGLTRSPWAAMNIHGGKGQRAERLITVIRNLPELIRTRLTLENDEYSYSAATTFEICQEAGIPMVFDAHHHACHEKLDSYDAPSVSEMLAAARTTWPVPEWQLVHISNGRTFFLDPHHSDFITHMPASYRQPLWIEVEAKMKEEAIARLQHEWLTMT